MTRLGFGLALVTLGASILSAQAPGTRPAHVSASRPQPAFQPPPTFKKYCFECHGGEKHRGDLSIERLIQQSAQPPSATTGTRGTKWSK
jgi:hypothetical protein